MLLLRFQSLKAGADSLSSTRSATRECERGWTWKDAFGGFIWRENGGCLS